MIQIRNLNMSTLKMLSIRCVLPEPPTFLQIRVRTKTRVQVRAVYPTPLCLLKLPTVIPLRFNQQICRVSMNRYSIVNQQICLVSMNKHSIVRQCLLVIDHRELCSCFHV
uniref:Uncharacterized protein n=1 Tax=Cacopsylla melanoneura TaxID=428564 RepID=A0A8D9B4F4_9HEMI